MIKVLSPLVLAFYLVLASPAPAAGPSYKIHVAGLACPFCAYGIEKSLGALNGVESIETHIREGALIVRMNEGSTLSEDNAEQAVEDAGFTLERFEVAPANE